MKATLFSLLIMFSLVIPVGTINAEEKAMQTALDYRQNYDQNPGFARNPLTTGQWVMIGAGALAVGGLAFWGVQAWRKKKAEEAASGNTVAQNPGLQSVHHHYPRAA